MDRLIEVIKATRWTEVSDALSECKDLNVVDECGWSALHWAVDKKNLFVVERLVESGIDIHLKDGQGKTAMQNAAMIGHYDVLEYLIECGSDINTQDNDGDTALKYTISLDHGFCSQLLLEKGADPLIENHKGKSAYWWANRMKRPVFHLMQAMIEKEKLDCLVKEDCTNQELMEF